MLSNILPLILSEPISKLNSNKLCEIRIRIGQAVIVDYGGLYYLSEKGITDKPNLAIVANNNMIEEIIKKTTENSLYAYNEELKQGFLTAQGGIRIGVCGECVCDNDKIKTIKNISSLNIRIPHEIANCSVKLLPFLTEPTLQNTLIIAPPGAGKTTILRDLSIQLSNRYLKNVLIVDERNEIANCVNGKSQNTVGVLCDVMTNCTKQFGLENGIRSMKPDVVMTDEIANEKDINAIEYALGCGVKVVATTHCLNIDELKNKQYFSKVLEKKLFDKYVVLSTKNGAGTVEAIYSKDFSCLYL